MVGVQLLREAVKFEAEAKELLLQENNGILSVGEINLQGRRVQDKERLKEQVRVEKSKAENLTREVLTYDLIKLDAKKEVLSNDKVMRLGKERLQARVKIAEISTKKFWEKELVIPADSTHYKVIMRTAWKSFPKMHQVVHRKKDAKPVHTKTEALKIIGTYLRRSKDTVKRIIDFAYGTPWGSNSGPKRDREWEASDLLELFRLFRIVGEAFEGKEEVCDNASLAALGLFKKIDTHYTYTLPKETDETATDDGGSVTNAEDACDEDIDGSALEELDDDLCFVRISYFFR